MGNSISSPDSMDCKQKTGKIASMPSSSKETDSALFALTSKAASKSDFAAGIESLLTALKVASRTIAGNSFGRSVAGARRRLHSLIALMLFAFLPAFLASPASTQEVYTNLKKPEHIQVFNKVSDSVICQCGCHFILSSCPHVECPWGIPVRRFMENRIQEGMDAETIIYHLEHGFGKKYMNDPIILELQNQGRMDLVGKIIDGHGSKIRGTTANWIPILLISVFVITGLLIAVRYFRRRDPFGDLSHPESEGADGANGSGSTDGQEDVDLDRFKDIDR